MLKLYTCWLDFFVHVLRHGFLLYIYIYICVCVCVWVCLSTPPYELDAAQGQLFKQSLTDVNSKFPFA